MLLSALDDNREMAAAKYEQIRRAMIVFFEFRGSQAPADDADETIDRVARRLHEGREIFSVNPASYFYAVARNVWRERLAAPITQIPLDTAPVSSRYRMRNPQELLEDTDQHTAKEIRLTCLENCLHKLKPHERQLIEAYYHGNGREKIENRQALAFQLGIPLNALRIRAHRLREKLEACVGQCTKFNSLKRR